MKQRVLVSMMTLATTFLMPLAALADEKEPYDARLEGYEKSITLDGGNTGLTWLLLVVLGALCIGVLFKSAGRTHLD